MWHVENSTFHLLQQLPQVVVIERQGTLQGCNRVVDGRDERKGIRQGKRRKARINMVGEWKRGSQLIMNYYNK